MCKMCVEKNNDQFQTLEIGWHTAESIPLNSTRILGLSLLRHVTLHHVSGDLKLCTEEKTT